MINGNGIKGAVLRYKDLVIMVLEDKDEVTLE